MVVFFRLCSGVLLCCNSSIVSRECGVVTVPMGLLFLLATHKTLSHLLFFGCSETSTYHPTIHQMWSTCYKQILVVVIIARRFYAEHTRVFPAEMVGTQVNTTVYKYCPRCSGAVSHSSNLSTHCIGYTVCKQDSNQLHTALNLSEDISIQQHCVALDDLAEGMRYGAVQWPDSCCFLLSSVPYL